MYPGGTGFLRVGIDMNKPFREWDWRLIVCQASWAVLFLVELALCWVKFST